MEAFLEINLGEKAKHYIKIIDMPKEYKRSKVKVSEKGGKIKVNIEAEDAVALIASLSSIIKQMRVVSAVDNIINNSTKK
ncbi:MAG: KEOPS complex subunit Pcc1 [Candidatus Micrarchaeia archaeon]|jgi:tRNA threonylcarbamoyladenosine modification (KEOPS) complex  Pcc1 subunit